MVSRSALLLVCLAGCESAPSDFCNAGGDGALLEVGPDGAAPPAWAVGEFSVFQEGAQVWNLRVEASGRFQLAVYGGDFFGCETGTVAVSAGEVRLESSDRPPRRMTGQGEKVFLESLSLECERVGFARGTLCAAGVLDEGVIEEVEACEWEDQRVTCG